jgi:hypothetical protein
MSTGTTAEKTEARGLKLRVGYYIDKSGCERCGAKTSPLYMNKDYSKSKVVGESMWVCSDCDDELDDEKNEGKISKSKR